MKEVRRVVMVALVLVLGVAAAILADVLRPSSPKSVAPIQLDTTRGKEERNRDNEPDEDRARRPNNRPDQNRDPGGGADVPPDGAGTGGAVDDGGDDDSDD
jgi:hypothetical protein